MTGLLRFFRRAPVLSAEDARRLAAWKRRGVADLNAAFEDARYVVVDVESTGLDLGRDRLIAIGACAVRGGRVALADSFEVVLRQDRGSDKDNILIHGIGGETQREGVKPARGLLDFLEYLGDSPLVAFHVAFDETMIRRALRQYLGLNFRHAWLDLAYVLPGLLPEYARRYRALDDWAAHFGIGNFARHSALADALCTAELLLGALPLARGQRALDYRHLQALEKAQRWAG